MARSPVAWPWPATDTVLRTIGRNAADLTEQVVKQGRTGGPLTVDGALELARDWHRALLHRVPLAAPEVAGGFRGSPEPARLRTSSILFGHGPAGRPDRSAASVGHVGPEGVADALAAYGSRLVRDDTALGDQPLESEVLDLCAWAAVEWADIHPFVDLNGATGRLWVTFLAARHGVGLAMAAKPRPDRVYELPTGEEFAYTRGVRSGTEDGDLAPLRRWLGFEASFQARGRGGVTFVDQRG